MTKLTNNASGPRSVHTTDGYVTIMPGQTSADLDISEADLKAINAAGVLDEADVDPSAPRSIPGYPNLSLPPATNTTVAPSEEASKEEGPKPLTRMNKAELTTAAEAEGVEIKDGASNKEIAAAIQAKRDAAPPVENA